MKIFLDQLIEQLEPWDLVVNVGGADYQVRPMTLGNLAVLLGALNAKPPRIDEYITTLEGMFHNDPGVRGWPPELAFKVGTQIAEYFGSRANPRAASAPVRRPQGGKAAESPENPPSAPSEAKEGEAGPTSPPASGR